MDSVSPIFKGVEILPDGSVARTGTNYSGKFQEAHDASKASIQSRISNLESGGVKDTGKEYKNYKDVEYTGTTKVNGEVRDISRRVFQRLDIDYMRIDPKTGMTNLQLMKKGRAPIWQDGTAIELHHLIQREPGSMVELPGSMHKEYYKILHGKKSFNIDK